MTEDASLSVPAERVVLPVYVLAPVSSRVPAPAFVTPPAPERTPLHVIDFPSSGENVTASEEIAAFKPEDQFASLVPNVPPERVIE